MLLLLSLGFAAPEGPGERPSEQARWLLSRWSRAREMETHPPQMLPTENPAVLWHFQERAWLRLEMELAETRWRGDDALVRLLAQTAANARIAARAKASELLAGRDRYTAEGRGHRSVEQDEWRLATRLDAWTWRTPAPVAAPILLELELLNIESDLRLPARCWPRDTRPAEPLLQEARVALVGGDPVVQGALTVILVEAHQQVDRTRCATARGPVEAPPTPPVEVPVLPAPLVAWKAKLDAHLDDADAAPARAGEALEQAIRELLVWELPSDLPPELAEAANRQRWEAVLDGAERSWRAWEEPMKLPVDDLLKAGTDRCAALMAYALDELRGAPPRVYP